MLDIFKNKEPENRDEQKGNSAVDELIEIATSTNLKLGYTQDNTGDWAGLYLPETDRSTHVYVLGSSGVGKSKGMANWILEDINHERGCGVIDPHGHLIINDANRIITSY